MPGPARCFGGPISLISEYAGSSRAATLVRLGQLSKVVVSMLKLGLKSVTSMLARTYTSANLAVDTMAAQWYSTGCTLKRKESRWTIKCSQHVDI